eukprot:scaffold29530_cov71-Phaeocystis_antarctica.AAC.3
MRMLRHRCAGALLAAKRHADAVLPAAFTLLHTWPALSADRAHVHTLVGVDVDGRHVGVARVFAVLVAERQDGDAATLGVKTQLFASVARRLGVHAAVVGAVRWQHAH